MKDEFRGKQREGVSWILRGVNDNSIVTKINPPPTHPQKEKLDMISINTSFIIPYKFFNTDKKYIYFTKAQRVLDLNNSQKTPKTWKSILKNSLNKLPQPLKKN